MRVDTPELERVRRFVAELNVQWQMFDELYGTPEHLAVFNRTGARFWSHLKSNLLDLLFLSVSRFFDRAQTGSQQNFSLSHVLEFPELIGIRPDLQKRIDTMRPIWERGIKIWRHKYISHADKATAMGTTRLPDVPFADLKELVIGISEFVSEIDLRLNQVRQTHEVQIEGWIPQVLEYLKLGISAKDEELEELRRSNSSQNRNQDG